MSKDDATRSLPTRRDTIRYGSALAVGGMVAGCIGESSEPTGDSNGSGETESYSVTMSPVGTVEFDSVPEEAVVYDAQVADHLVAIGQQDRITALGFPDRFYTGFYEELPGVSFDTDGVTALFADGSLQLDKEILYELDGDIHHIDPLRWQNIGIFDDADIEEIRTNIAPFFCNRYSRAHSYKGDASYEYYSLWELLDKYAQVYQVRSRSRELKAVRDEMLESIHAELPPEEDRPEVALVVYNPEEETFGPYRLNGEGFGKAHTRPLRANDALEEGTKSYASDYSQNYSMEAMVEFDPDVMLHNFDWTNPRDRTEAFFGLDEHSVGSEIAAVENDRLYATGSGLQGPIWNLFQLEIAAKQIYPDLFGEPPEPDSSVPEDERLFDRQEVADIINGDD